MPSPLVRLAVRPVKLLDCLFFAVAFGHEVDIDYPAIARNPITVVFDQVGVID